MKPVTSFLCCCLLHSYMITSINHLITLFAIWSALLALHTGWVPLLQILSMSITSQMIWSACASSCDRKAQSGGVWQIKSSALDEQSVKQTIIFGRTALPQLPDRLLGLPDLMEDVEEEGGVTRSQRLLLQVVPIWQLDWGKTIPAD